MNWLIICGIGVLLLVLLVITKITVDIKYVHKTDDDLLEVKVSLWKMRVYTFSAPLIKIDLNSKSIVVDEEMKAGTFEKEKKKRITLDQIIRDIHKLNEFIQHVAGLHKIVKRFLHKMNVQHLTWKSDFGVGNAAYTGQLIGLVWIIKGLVIGLIGNYMNVKSRPKVTVIPDFQRIVTYTNLSCMISFRIGHAIVAGLMIAKHWRRRPKLFQHNSVEKTSNV